jgi:HIV Tat-specific factor 1
MHAILIIIFPITGLFTSKSAADDAVVEKVLDEISSEIESKCGEFDGDATFYSNHYEAPVQYKFKSSYSADKCIELMNNRSWEGRVLTCQYWDGVTNYKAKSDGHADKQRIDDFGDWLNEGDLDDEDGEEPPTKKSKTS